MATSQEDMPEPRAPEVKGDILGADWNQGVSQLAQQFKEFIEKNELTPVPPELLALRKGDCCGFLVFAGFSKSSLSVVCHARKECYNDLEIKLKGELILRF